MITATVSVLLWVKFRKHVYRFCTLKYFLNVFLALVMISLIMLICYCIQLRGTVRRPTSYIVDTEGCLIPDLDPWDPLILSYIKAPELPVCKNGKPPLVKTNKNKLFIVREAIPMYVKSNQSIFCCYQPFWRHPSDHPGKEYEKIFSPNCTPFYETIIYDEYILVKCFALEVEIFREYYAFVQVKPDVEARCESFSSNNESSPFSVLILGIDGMSRNHLYRNMPRTVEFLHKISAIDMAGNNVVGPQTIYNLIPVLTGLSFPDDTRETCWPDSDAEFDLCPWIFRNFSKAGFRTAFGENMADWSTFISDRAGFRVQPTDYYLQPLLSLDGELKKNHVEKFCFGYRTESQLLIDYVDEFITTMNSKSFFGFFWDASLTYHDFNVHSYYDNIYLNFLQKHIYSGYLNRTVLLFLSDHGFRWGEIRKTFQGLQEQRNPFLFLLLPEKFKSKYNVATRNIYNNTHRLVTVFDVHETLRDILKHTQMLEDNVCLNRSLQLKQRTSLPRGISLFLPIPESRTCSAAGIEANLCLCQIMDPLPINNKVVRGIAFVLLQDLSGLVSKHPECTTMELSNIHSAWVHRQNRSILQSMDKMFEDDVKGNVSDLVDFTVIVRTKPGDALFEATYRYCPGSWKVLSSFELVGNIQRINKINNQSYCIDDVMLKPFCFCN